MITQVVDATAMRVVQKHLSNHADKKSIKINRAVQNFFLHSPVYFMSAFLCRVS